jgi:hypothetical protein
MKDSLAQEIHGFLSPGEYQRFVAYLEAQLKAGVVQEVPPNPGYGKGEIYGGRWFRVEPHGETWRLVPPDFPFKGLWEPVIIS